MARRRLLNVTVLSVFTVVALVATGCEGLPGVTVVPADETSEARETPAATPDRSPDGTVTTRPTASSGVTSTPVSGGRPNATSTVGTSSRAPTATPVRRSPPVNIPGSAGGDPARSVLLGDVKDLKGGELLGTEDVSLGILLPPDESFDSICNGGGVDGGLFGAISIFNPMSSYGGPFGANSPFNPDTSAPPRIFVDGEQVGHMSLSPYVDAPVDPHVLLASLGCPTTAG